MANLANLIDVDVRLFASLRELFGTDRVVLRLGTEACIADLIAAMDAAFATLPARASEALRAANVRIAVNQVLIEGDVRLRDGDEIAFLPPVTGG